MENRQFNRGIHITIKHSFARNVQHLCSDVYKRQEYKREKPVNQQDKLTQTHYPQTEHSPKSQQKRYFISHDKVRIIYFQSSVLVRAMPSLTPVSYTHLDVYKRQPYNKNLRILAIQFRKPEAAFTESCNKIPGYILSLIHI